MNPSLENYINDPESDLSSAAIIKKDGRYCFIVQPKERWGKNCDGDVQIPFGGIGGKVESGESPSEALLREAVEEIGAEIEIIKGIGNSTYIISPDGISKEQLASDTETAQPLYIFRNPRSEKGRKPWTNVFVYAASIKSGNLKPVDNPAIIQMDEGLLIDAVKGKITIGDAISRDMIIESTVKLPSNALLAPTPTPRGFVRCLEEIRGFRENLSKIIR